MADAGDLKSLDREIMSVRVRQGPPELNRLQAPRTRRRSMGRNVARQLAKGLTTSATCGAARLNGRGAHDQPLRKTSSPHGQRGALVPDITRRAGSEGAVLPGDSLVVAAWERSLRQRDRR